MPVNLIEALPVLREARKRVAAGWSQYVGARDRNGRAVNVDSPDACEFCITGALAVSGDRGSAGGLLRRLLGMQPHKWNDTKGRTHEEVLNLFDEAISVCESELCL